MSNISRDELIAHLTRHRNFAGLESDDLQVLLDIAKLERAEAGATIFSKGDPLEGGYVLVAGHIEQAENPYPHRTLHRQSFASGSLFGIGGFIQGWQSRLTCVAIEETTYLFIDRGAFLRQIDAGNGAAFRLVDALLDLYVKEVQAVNQHLDDIYNRPNETLEILRDTADAQNP